MMKKIVRVVVVVIMLLCIFNNSYAMGQRPQIQETNKDAPDFSLYDLQGKAVSLSDFKGRNQIILFFWTTWCPHCVNQITELNKLEKRVEGKNVKILTIDVGESSRKVKEFVLGRPIFSTVLLDLDKRVAMNYKVAGVPSFIIIGLDGSIKFKGNRLPPDLDTILSDGNN